MSFNFGVNYASFAQTVTHKLVQPLSFSVSIATTLNKCLEWYSVLDKQSYYKVFYKFVAMICMIINNLLHC